MIHKDVAKKYSDWLNNFATDEEIKFDKEVLQPHNEKLIDGHSGYGYASDRSLNLDDDHHILFHSGWLHYQITLRKS